MSNGHQRFNWGCYLDFARALLQEIPEGQDDECKVRCGISRAYYAVFHRAREYLHRVGVEFDIYGKGSHENLISEYRRLGKNGCREYGLISVKLERLKKLRIKADYYDVFFGSNESLGEGCLRKKLQIVINDADIILEAIELIERKEEE